MLLPEGVVGGIFFNRYWQKKILFEEISSFKKYIL